MILRSLTNLRFRRDLTALSLAAIISLGLVVFGSVSVPAASGPCTVGTDYGQVTDTITVPATGTYRIWSRMAAADTTNNTYMLEVDGTSCYTVGGSLVPTYTAAATTHFTTQSSNWISKTSGGTQIDVSLTAGTHTLKLIGNAPNVIVDRLVLTQDTGCTPTGNGDNCASPPDTTPPTVAITSPTANAAISATTTVTANATDDTIVSKVEFYVDGALAATDTTGDASHNFSFSLNPTSLSIGAHTLVAKAYDSSSNVTSSSSVPFTVADTVSPVVSLTAPAAGDDLAGTVALTATATDNHAVSRVEFYVDGSLQGADTTASGTAYSISFDTSTIDNGSHTFTAKAYDAASNTTTSSAISATVTNPTTPAADTTPPTVTMTSPVSGATISGTYVMAATAIDTSGIQQVQFYVDNVLKNTDTTAPFSYSLDTTTLANAAHNFKVVATDKSTAHNAATSAVATATVRNIVYKTADINMDGSVNILDFSLLKSKFGQTGSSLGRADITGDTIVDIRDFSVLKAQFGT